MQNWTSNYYCLPDSYGNSTVRYPDRYEAFAEAAKKLSRILFENEHNERLVPLRVFVDKRERDERGDRIVRRFVLELQDVTTA